MTIILYSKKADGSVVGYQRKPDNVDDNKLEEMVREYNTKNPDILAVVGTVKPGSFPDYLIRALEKEQENSRAAIQDAVNALNNAANYVSSLLPQPSEKED